MKNKPNKKRIKRDMLLDFCSNCGGQVITFGGRGRGKQKAAENWLKSLGNSKVQVSGKSG